MAEIAVEGNDLVLRLSRIERVEGIHGDLRVPRSSVRGIEVLDDAHAAADFGLKVGTRIPGVVEVGSIQGGGKRVFAVVHRETPRGLRVELEGNSYDEWIVGCANPEEVAAQLAPEA